MAERIDAATLDLQEKLVEINRVAKTVKGKGISFAENVVGFHNGALTAQQYAQACAELAETLKQEVAQ